MVFFVAAFSLVILVLGAAMMSWLVEKCGEHPYDVIIRVLKQKDWQRGREIVDASGGILQHGNVYVHLTKMEANGWVTSQYDVIIDPSLAEKREHVARRMYALTAKGRRAPIRTELPQGDISEVPALLASRGDFFVQTSDLVAAFLFIVYATGMKKLVSVGEAARIMDVTPETIRKWEKKGLVKAQRSDFKHRVFDLEEIKKVQRNASGVSQENNYRVLKATVPSNYQTIELFAGCGGTALGFEHAGLNHQLLVEWDKDSAATLRRNRPGWNILTDDFRSMDFAGMQADIIEGGFPCQSFSYAGKRKGFEDARGTLFYEFARCIKAVQPKIAMGENVKGLLRHENGETLRTMVGILDELGYRVAYKILRAQYFDVAQKRERLIILAVRNDLDMPICFPRERGYTVSLRECLDGCPKSPGQAYPDRKKQILDMVPPGGYWKDLPVGVQMEYMKASFYMGGGKTGMARRLAWEEPSLTLTCAPAQKQTERCHPSETRPLTVREYARIQSFPDDWIFDGSVTSQYKQIGNAVPVNLGYHVGRCLRAMLDGKPDPETMDIVEIGEESTFNARTSLLSSSL